VDNGWSTNAPKSIFLSLFESFVSERMGDNAELLEHPRRLLMDLGTARGCDAIIVSTTPVHNMGSDGKKSLSHRTVGE
jgi:hypothetical protein